MKFSTKKTNKKNMGLKQWILPKDHFKTHLIFSIFFLGGGPFSKSLYGETGLIIKAENAYL